MYRKTIMPRHSSPFPEGHSLPGIENGDSELQSFRAVLHYRQGRLQQACTSHLTCFALSLHDTRHTHQVKHIQDIEDLEDAGMH